MKPGYEFIIGLDQFDNPATYTNQIKRYVMAVVEIVTPEQTWYTYYPKRNDWVYTSFSPYNPPITLELQEKISVQKESC